MNRYRLVYIHFKITFCFISFDNNFNNFNTNKYPKSFQILDSELELVKKYKSELVSAYQLFNKSSLEQTDTNKPISSLISPSTKVEYFCGGNFDVSNISIGEIYEQRHNTIKF
jgi:hypothetical protein